VSSIKRSRTRVARTPCDKFLYGFKGALTHARVGGLAAANLTREPSRRPQRGMTGGLPTPGASAKAAPCRAKALRARRADAGRPPRFPRPVVARRYAPTGTGIGRKAAVDGERRSVRVQLRTARADRQDRHLSEGRERRVVRN
jgi:hypothetical protein